MKKKRRDNRTRTGKKCPRASGQTTLTFTLSDEEKNTVMDIAKQTGRSQSSLMKRVLQWYMEAFEIEHGLVLTPEQKAKLDHPMLALEYKKGAKGKPPAPSDSPDAPSEDTQE